MQKPGNFEEFGPLLVMVARRWRLELDWQLASAGLSDATWRPLYHLHMARAPIAQKDLAPMVGIDGSTLVRLLDSLEDRGLVKRHCDPLDRRGRWLVITAPGKRLIVRIRKALQSPEAQLLQGVDATEMTVMVRGLERIRENLLRLHVQRAEA